MRHLTLHIITLTSLAILAAAPLAFSQVDVATATLSGVITDPSAAVVGGAAVTVTSADRGIVRETISSAGGTYQIPLLPPGQYLLRVQAPGFQVYVASNVVLTVGQSAVVDVPLKVGNVTVDVEVQADVPQIDPQRTQQSGTIDELQIRSLPLVDRNFVDLAFTQPGVVSTAPALAQNTRIGTQRSSGMSVGGGNGRSNYFTIDGGENELGTGGLRVRNLSVEAVQEFQINRNAFAAEYGFTAGTATNVITKSGGNAFHGSAYGFYRSQKTSARNAFDFVDRKRFDQLVYAGATAGGPIVRNKTFYFSSYEGLKLDEARFKSYLQDPAVLTLTPGQQEYFNALTTGPTATGTTAGIAQTFRNMLALDASTLEFLGNAGGARTLPTRTHNWTSRLDHLVGADNVTGRFTLGRENNSLLGMDNVESFGRGVNERQRDYTALGTWSHFFGPALVNQARFQFAKDSLAATPLSPSPMINIAGLVNFGRGAVVPSLLEQKRYQAEDVVSLYKGSHTLKFGVSYRPVDLKNSNEIFGAGFFQFSALPLQLLIDQSTINARNALNASGVSSAAAGLTPLQAFDLGIPFFYQQGFGDPLYTGVQTNLGAFVQDSWKPARRLTVDAGVRVDHDGEPRPLYVNNYVSPRLGLAWDVFGNGKTLLRAGGGTFYSPVTAMIFAAATLQSEEADHLIITGRALTARDVNSQRIWSAGVAAGKLPYQALNANDLNGLAIVVDQPKQPGRRVSGPNSDYENPSTIQFSAGLSQQLAGDLALEVSYQGYRGVHLPMAVETNYREAGDRAARCAEILPPLPSACSGASYGPILEPIDPAIQQKITHTSWGNSIYHGMTVSLEKRYRRNFQFQLHYTFGKAIDDVLDFSGISSPFLPTRRYLDRALSAFDIRHNFVASGIFTSPFRNAILRGVTVSPIVNLRSGAPFTLIAGSDTNGDYSAADRPFYAPRNSGLGPSYYSTNLRLNKKIGFRGAAPSEKNMAVELIAEAANLFNKTNFLRVNDVVCAAPCESRFLNGPFDFEGSREIPPTQPLGFTAAHPGRQIQFGMKLVF